MPARHASGIREQYATRAAFLITGLGMSSWAPLVPFAKARVGADDGTLGLLLLCLGLGSIVTMPLTGMVTSRWGCRLVIATATLLLAGIIPVLAFASSVPLLAVAIAAFGAGMGALSVSINVQAVMVENDSGRHMMSGFHGLFSVGGIIGAGSVSLLIGAGLEPFIVTLVVSALIVILLVLAWSGLLPYGNRDAGQTPLFVLPRGFVIFLGALCFLVFLAEGAMLDWSAVFLISVHGLDHAQAGLGYSVFALAMAVGRLSGDWLVKTFGGMLVVVAGGVLAAAGLLLAVVAPTAWLAFGGFLLVGLGLANLVPVFFTVAGRQTIMPPSFAIASITAIGYAGILLGPAGIGFVAEHFSLEMSFALMALGLLLVAVSGPKATKG
ncbi:MAG: transporter [Rhizobium sp.]|nr:transporter [Rhizobium sp.]